MRSLSTIFPNAISTSSYSMRAADRFAFTTTVHPGGNSSLVARNASRIQRLIWFRLTAMPTFLGTVHPSLRLLEGPLSA